MRAEKPATDFARDVQPILAQHCYACHGPDAATRKADLRLDQRDSALEKVSPGHSGASELYRRLVSSDPDVRMPPPGEQHQPSLEEIATLKRWIEAGAPWQELWSLQPITRPSIPSVERQDWPTNDIDYFTLAEMEANRVWPAGFASRYAWLRRVTFDLTGLPPSPAEIDAFVSDTSSQAERKVIDRLLASPAYGENFARRWLDLARYADTHGYNVDSHRDMWRYREWVIESLNANMRFDQFTIEQLAGDLLPNPTVDQLTATGFHRNLPVNDENGAFAEEYRHAYVVDRVNTTGSVWLGMTLGCAQCHDHKYDPISQRDFYQLAAFFDNIDEKGLDGQYGNAGPVIKSPTREQQEKLADLETKLGQLRQPYADYLTTDDPLMIGWETKAREEGRAEVVSQEKLLAKLDFDTTSPFPSGIRLVGDGSYVTGKQGQALVAGGNMRLNLLRDPQGPLSVAAWLYPTVTRPQVLYALRCDNGDMLQLVQAKDKFTLTSVKADDTVITREAACDPWETNVWQHVAFAIDPSAPGDARVWMNGKRLSWQLPTTTSLDEDEVDDSQGEWLFAIRGLLDDVRIDARIWSNREATILAEDDPISALLAKAPRERTETQSIRLKTFYLRETNENFVRLEQQMEDLRRKIELLWREFPETMVMREREEPRVTHVRIQGQWDQLGDVVKPGVPRQLYDGNARGRGDRLQLAKWLVSAGNPLTARVVVNRTWQHYFGTGLVKTIDDFGTRGELPTHPELLDYLASELIDSGWDMKHLHRLIVSSSTYRQSSSVSKARYEADPENRFLARGPRLRLTGEELRDQALAASGLLVRQIGGVSVKPYQPPGLWEELSKGSEFTAQRFVQDHGDRLYRRSLYTYWKRSSPPPNMIAFDAPNREICVAQRSRTNTPMQALVLLNDVTFVEAAKVLAADVLKNQGNRIDAAMGEAFLRVLSRPIRPDELAMLEALYRQELQRFTDDPQAMNQWLGEGEMVVAASPELAAMAVICHTIFNLDEAVMTP
ncbi:Planctomycete cytochrome C [Bremerella volcania]|uniref:Planctomycete cytochrome C n=1 Tax=Bremerella volcania TaxID=2527984 RepID=A0A518C209_9BACT|nr:DUF1553 domain-containing protein [Bremerella volcania]QDU73258.1 Planctomycete cytochrome C [Bremerella volcania]